MSQDSVISPGTMPLVFHGAVQRSAWSACMEEKLQSRQPRSRNRVLFPTCVLMDCQL